MIGAAGDLEQAQEAVEVDRVRICGQARRRESGVAALRYAACHRNGTLRQAEVLQTGGISGDDRRGRWPRPSALLCASARFFGPVKAWSRLSWTTSSSIVAHDLAGMQYPGSTPACDGEPCPGYFSAGHPACSFTGLGSCSDAAVPTSASLRMTVWRRRSGSGQGRV